MILSLNYFHFDSPNRLTVCGHTDTKHDCMSSINEFSVKFFSVRSSASPVSFVKIQNPNPKPGFDLV